jgi:hypothetical protein
MQDLENTGDMYTSQEIMDIYEEWQQRHEANGARAGMARLLMIQLAQRFGEVPAEVEERIRQASADTLTRWAGRVLTAESIDDVLA